MNKRYRLFRLVLSSVRLLPHIALLGFAEGGEVFKADLVHWAQRFGLAPPTRFRDHAWLLVIFMTFTPEFRNLFYLRYGLKGRLFGWMCPRLASLDISCPSVGAGLFIQHGECTWVSAESIGENCWIGRLVVIGYSNETDKPTIGNNVRIYAGAKIIGKVKIGDNATIGLNTVITQDVPANATMLGVPGKVIWVAGEPPAQPPAKRLSDGHSLSKAPVPDELKTANKELQDRSIMALQSRMQHG
jgi:serine O-acetyltransferase